MVRRLPSASPCRLKRHAASHRRMPFWRNVEENSPWTLIHELLARSGAGTPSCRRDLFLPTNRHGLAPQRGRLRCKFCRVLLRGTCR